ncbi:fibrocystin-L, partial [Brachionus plicatilis]
MERVYCGGWLTKLENLKFINVQVRTIHRWDWDLVYDDVDGSLTDEQNAVVVYNNNFTMNKPTCHTDSRFINGTVCTDTKQWIRFAFNELQPDLVLRANITNMNGQVASTIKYAKRLTHLFGFMSALEANQEYLIEFDEALYPTNVSYSAGVYNIEPASWIIIKHRMWKKPDRVYFGTRLQIESFVPLTPAMDTGTWYWHNSTQMLSFILNNNINTAPFVDYQILLDAHVCRYAGCVLPVQPAYRLPVTERPPNALFWSNVETWAFAEPGWGGHVESRRAARSYQLPQEGESVKIPDGRYVVVDCPIPKLKYLQIEGILEFDNGLNHTVSAELIFINGGQLIIGWEKDPMLNDVDIILRGTKQSLNFYLPNGINNIGGKGIGVYGGLDLHGQPREPSWTTLSASALKNSSQISLSVPVDWKVGELVVIGSTSYHPNQTEILQIVDKSNDNTSITFNTSLKYDHMSYGETYPNGQSYRIAAPVGLLSRNIRIVGEQYPNQFSDLYGSRILVSDYSNIDSDLKPVFYKGYARISNVEFDLFGQFSRGDSDDYKYGILF